MLLSTKSFAEPYYSVIDMLVGKTWKMEVPAGQDSYGSYIKTFTTTTYTTIFQLTGNQPIVHTYQYHLSNTIETSFDENKLGDPSFEKYMVIRVDEQDEDIHVHEIISISPTHLELKHVVTGSIIKYNAE